jgi:hypothetical protein
VVGVNLQTGDITPLSKQTAVEKEILLRVPTPGINCVCDIHFQHHIVIGADNREGVARASPLRVPDDRDGQCRRREQAVFHDRRGSGELPAPAADGLTAKCCGSRNRL